MYVDWGDAREYTIGDIGIGECAGEPVETADFGVAEGERLVFEAQVELDEGNTPGPRPRVHNRHAQGCKGPDLSQKHRHLPMTKIRSSRNSKNAW